MSVTDKVFAKTLSAQKRIVFVNFLFSCEGIGFGKSLSVQVTFIRKAHERSRLRSKSTDVTLRRSTSSLTNVTKGSIVFA